MHAHNSAPLLLCHQLEHHPRLLPRKHWEWISPLVFKSQSAISLYNGEHINIFKDGKSRDVHVKSYTI